MCTCAGWWSEPPGVRPTCLTDFCCSGSACCQNLLSTPDMLPGGCGPLKLQALCTDHAILLQGAAARRTRADREGRADAHARNRRGRRSGQAQVGHPPRTAAHKCNLLDEQHG